MILIAGGAAASALLAGSKNEDNQRLLSAFPFNFNLQQVNLYYVIELYFGSLQSINDTLNDDNDNLILSAPRIGSSSSSKGGVSVPPRSALYTVSHTVSLFPIYLIGITVDPFKVICYQILAWIIAPISIYAPFFPLFLRLS